MKCDKNNWFIKLSRYIIPSRAVAGKISHHDNQLKIFNISYCICSRQRSCSEIKGQYFSIHNSCSDRNDPCEYTYIMMS